MSYAENDAEFRALAVEMLEEFGAPAQLTTRTAGEYDPSTGALSGNVEKTYKNVLATPPVPASEIHKSRDNQLQGEAASFVAASTAPVEPAPEMALLLAGQRWIVLEVRTYYSGAQAAAYELGLRRG